MKLSLKRVKKSIEISRFRTRIIIKAFSPFRPIIIELILVMLPWSPLTEKLLTKSLFMDTPKAQAVSVFHI